MRLGIFGGTFDPPHCGHLELAQFVLENKSLDKLLLVPAFKTPYADKTTSASFKDRFSMTQIAVGNVEGLEVSDVEGVRGGESFTIDTVRYLKEMYLLEADQLFLIIGTDSLMRLDEWRSPDAILNECSVCVLKRPDVNNENFDKRFIDRVEILENELIAVSSSEIRNRIQEGGELEEFLDKRVIEYISERKLYSD